MSTVPHVPPGFRTVTPYLVVRDAASAVAYYEEAFAARELHRNPCPETGRLLSVKLQIGDSLLMLNDEFPDRGCLGPDGDRPSPVTIHLYVDDVDAVFEAAVNAGGAPVLAPADAFWGDRFALVVDPFGHRWSLATHIEDLSEEEIQTRTRRVRAGSPVSKKPQS